MYISNNAGNKWRWHIKPEIDEKAKQTVANHCSEEVGFFLTTIAKKKKSNCNTFIDKLAQIALILACKKLPVKTL